MTDKLNILTVGERDTLVECEKIIEAGQQTFVEVGLAIAKIRDKRLYRVGYKTFDEYCEKRWGWTRQRASQLIQSAAVVQALPPKVSTVVDSEWTAREVAKVEPERRAAVVKEAAKSGAVTAKTVKAAVGKLSATDAVLLDCVEPEYRRAIPAEIVGDWQRATATANDLLAKLRDAQRTMKEGLESSDIIYADMTNGDLSPLTQIIGTVSLHVKPHALCPVCHGGKPRKACKLCKGRGFIGRHLWQVCVDADTKKLIALQVKEAGK